MFGRLVAVICLLSAGACAVTVGGPVVPSTPVDLTRIVPGKTTRNDVLAMLGPPARAHQYRAEPGETWEYPYYGNYEYRVFWVQFQPDGKTVSKTEDTRDYNARPYRGR